MYKDPTILYQYQSTEKLKSLMEGTKTFFENNSKKSLFDFFDIDNSAGFWLDQLGAFLNLPRPLITIDNTFIIDDSLIDGTDLLDGTALAPDDVYKTYIKANILKRNSRFSIEDIISLLQFATGADKVFIAETTKTISIYLGVSNSDQERVSSLLNALDRKWFGVPSGVRLNEFKIVILPDDTNFFVIDSSLIDNINFVII